MSSRMSWDGKKLVWARYAREETTEQTIVFLQLLDEKVYTDQLFHRNTINGVRQELNSISLSLARQLVVEMPEIHGLLEQIRPEFKDKLDIIHPAKLEHHEQMAAIATEVWDILKNEKQLCSPYAFRYVSPGYPTMPIHDCEQACLVPTDRPESVDDIHWKWFLQHMESKEHQRVYQERPKKAQELQTELNSLLRSVKGTVADTVSSIRPLLEESFRAYLYNYGKSTNQESNIIHCIEGMEHRLVTQIYDSIVRQKPCDKDLLSQVLFTIVKLGTPDERRIMYQDVLLKHTLPDVEEALRILLEKCRERPEVVRISQLNSDLLSLFPKLEEELVKIIERRTISGKCEVCRGF